ncbi:Ig-like domain-containing protein [Streptomyces sp. NPDC001719]
MSLFRRSTSVPLVLALGAAALTLAAPAQADPGPAADTVTKLPVRSYGQMVVDEANQHVFITESSNSGTAAEKLLVYNFRGELVKTLDDVASATGMTLGADGRSLYVAVYGGVYEYDTATLTKKIKNYFPWAGCDRQIALSGDKLWYTQQHSSGQSCADGDFELWNVKGPADNETHERDFKYAINGPMRIATSPKLPGKMVLGTDATRANPNPALYLLDVSGEKIKIERQRFFALGSSAAGLDLKDMAFTPDGTRLAVADAKGGHRLLNTSDLSDAAPGYQPADGAVPTAVAFSGDGAYVARGAATPGGGAGLLVQNADPATGTQQRAFAFDGTDQGDEVAQRGLAWGEGGRTLFAVTTDAGHRGYWLRVLHDPQPMRDARFAGELAAGTQKPVVGAQLKINGRLERDGAAPAAPVKVTAVREDADGKHTLAPATVAEDGTFTVEDTPSRVGSATYTVSFAGDAAHRPAKDATLTVEVAKAGTAVTLAAPERSRIGHTLDFTGKLTSNGARIPDGQLVTVVRETPLGTKMLGTAPVAADGTFHVVDTPWTAGSTTYTVTWNGGGSHEGSSASATVKVGLRG